LKGGNQGRQKICRSIIFSPQDGYVYVGANSIPNAVKIWDVSLPDEGGKTVTGVGDTVVDFIHGKVNQHDFLGLVSDKKITIANLTIGI